MPSTDEIKKVLGVSPDDADALALLHAMPVQPQVRRGMASTVGDSYVGY